MRREKFLEVFDNLPTKRKQVLLGSLRGDTREKIMADVGVTQDALTQHRRQLYKDFQIEGFQNEADDPRSGERKLPQLIALCAQYQPELISPNTDRVSPAPGDSLLFPNFSTYNPQTWVGRELIVEELLAKLQGQTRLLWIKGISGIGKTTLGECLASKAWEKEPSFEWIYLEILEGQSPDFASVAADLLAKLGDRELDPQERNNPDRLAKRLLQKLQSHSYWIQMDSLERLLNPEQPNQFVDAYWATFFQRCLTESNVISRLVLTAQAFPAAVVEFSDRYPNTWAEYRLNGLLQLEQLEFFAKRGVVVEPSNQDILTRIAKIYEGHPLVLKVIAEDILQEFAGDVSRYWQIYQPEFEQVARELQATRLDETEYNEALDRKVRERIKKSLEKLPVDALDLLCRSAVFRRPVPKKFWLAMIGDRSSQQQQVAYRVLGDRALIEKEGTDIRQHNLIRAIAYDLLNHSFNLWESIEYQAANLWLTTYIPASDAPNIEQVRGYLEALYHYCQVKDWQRASELVLNPLSLLDNNNLNMQLTIWGFYQEMIQVNGKLFGKATVRENIAFSRSLGNAYYFLSDYQRAINYYQHNLVLAGEIDAQQETLKTLNNLGSVHRHLGDYITSIEYLEKALFIAREVDNSEVEAAALGSLGLSYHALGNYQKAIVFNQQSLERARKIKFQQAESIALCNLGISYHALGQYEQAIIFHQQFLENSNKVSYRRGEGIALMNLGRTECKLKKYDEALDSLNKSLIILREIGDRTDEAEALMGLGEVYHRIGNKASAQHFCQQALALATELNIPLVKMCEELRREVEEEHNTSN